MQMEICKGIFWFQQRIKDENLLIFNRVEQTHRQKDSRDRTHVIKYSSLLVNLLLFTLCIDDSFVWTSGISFLLWGWLSTDTCCSERLWNIPPWRYSKAIWMWSWATSSRLPCLYDKVIFLADQGKPVNVVGLDFSKPFCTVTVPFWIKCPACS